MRHPTWASLCIQSASLQRPKGSRRFRASATDSPNTVAQIAISIPAGRFDALSDVAVGSPSAAGVVAARGNATCSALSSMTRAPRSRLGNQCERRQWSHSRGKEREKARTERLKRQRPEGEMDDIKLEVEPLFSRTALSPLDYNTT